MLRRPKPTDSEADLLREQQELLAARGQSSVAVVKRPDKRRGDAAAAEPHEQGIQRDVVTIEDLPDELPTLTPAPPKKSRFKQERVRFEDEDPDERLDRHDTHISAVLSRIIERDTSAVPVSLPCITGTAFPKVLHRSVMDSEGQERALRGRKSIFARQIAAQRAKKEDVQSLNGSGTRDRSSASRHVENMETEQPESDVMDRVGGPVLLTGQGLGIANSAMETMKIHEENQSKLQTMSQSEILEEQRKLLAQLEEELPIKPQKEWLHMDKAMQARFDFAGTLIPPTKDLPTHLGLHHHGEEPELAGYSLQELFLLSRSQLNQQRNLAVSTLANVLAKARAGEYISSLKGSVLSSLLDAGLLFLLRFSLDDSVEGVMSAAVHALRALLVSSDDEECLDNAFPWLLGMATFPLLPTAQEDEDDEGLDETIKETAREKEEKKTDHDVASQDVVKGFLKMQGLPRLRYILEVVRPSPRVVLDILEVLIRIARHSTAAATQILACPRLMNTVISEFLPCSWAPATSQALSSLYGLPVALAMKLLRVLASAGRHACARILNSLGGKELLSRFVVVEPSEMLLETGEALRCSTEALRLFAVAASYGQACNLYTDLYPVLVKRLQAGNLLCASSEAVPFLELDRIKALMVLLTRVTQTAGSHEELQRGLVRSSSMICNPGLSAAGGEVVPSLPGLGCSRLKTSSTMAGPNTPLSLPTALLYLLNTITSIHKGLTKKFSHLILSDSVLSYLRSCIGAMPSVSHMSAWILHHEHHLLYLLLRLAHKLVPVDPEVAKHAALFHQVSLALVSWLLPGSEYLAHELMSVMTFSHCLLPEGVDGETEVAALAELQLKDRTSPAVGALLRDALQHLPSIRGCYLTHLAHLESSVLSSRDRYLGRTPFVSSHLLPELTGPSLPTDWPFLPLISLYERMGLSAGGEQQVESLPAGSVQSVTHCLQWLLVLESWREQALTVVPPVAKLARLACVFLCSSDLFLERPVQELTWALFRGLTRPAQLEALDLGSPPPGLASFHDLYSALLAQYEAVSFGDPLFGCFMLLPLQRRYSVTMRLAVFGEHVGMLRSLGVSLQQEKEAARRSLLRKTYYLTDEVLKNHLLLFRLPQQNLELGFSTYEQLPPIRARRLESIVGKEVKGGER
ncbi:hypothetical protein cypCar_00030640 [Cyprinus carpio]|nr:hypothetical protein cypCar_00030640 [Cyprinus carpio]